MRSCFSLMSRSFFVLGLKALQMWHLAVRCDSPRHFRQESCGSPVSIDLRQAKHGFETW